MVSIKGTSESHLMTVLYWLSRLKVASQDQLKAVTDPNGKIATRPKLKGLEEDGLVRQTATGLYSATPDLVSRLRQKKADLVKLGLNPEIIPNAFEGDGYEHQQAVSAYIIKEKPFVFYFPFFKNIGLRPDCLLVYYEVGKRYKLTFLEIEHTKGNWSEYIEAKKQKYAELGQDAWTYSVWWKEMSYRFNLPYCSEEQFCFGVKIEKK